MLLLDRRGEFVELRRIVNADFDANLIAGSFDRAFGRLDCLLDLFDFLNLVAELRIERAFGQQIVS